VQTEMLKMLEEAFAESKHWNDLSYEEKNERLFHEQKKVLDMFLIRNAISKEDYTKSMHDLVVKTGHTY